MPPIIYLVSAVIVTPDSAFHAKSLAYTDKVEAHRVYISALRSYLVFAHGGYRTGVGFQAYMANEAELDEIYCELLRVAKKSNGSYALITEQQATMMSGPFGTVRNYDISYTKEDPRVGHVSGVESLSARSVTSALRWFARKHGPLAVVVGMDRHPFEGFTEEFFRRILSNT